MTATTSARSGVIDRNRLAIAFALSAAFFVVGLAAGFITGSNSLLADAGHMLADVVGMGMALAAISLAHAQDRKSLAEGSAADRGFGIRPSMAYRIQMSVALAISVVLFAMAIVFVVRAVSGIVVGSEVRALSMLIVALVGLAVNVSAFLLLREESPGSAKRSGIYLEMLADTIGSFGVIFAAIVLEVTGWTWADSIVGVGLALWILPRSFRLARQAIRILRQAAPPDLDLRELDAALHLIDGVVGVVDLDVKTLTADMDAATAGLTVTGAADHGEVLRRARVLFEVHCDISHGTLRIESDDGATLAEASW